MKNTSDKPAANNPPNVAALAQACFGSAILFEGIALPPMLRAQQVENTFAIGHGALYGHLNAGRIRSIAVRGDPGQKRCTRLIFTQSIIDFLRSCEAQEGVRP
jgi:hypothetical protein